MPNQTFIEKTLAEWNKHHWGYQSLGKIEDLKAKVEMVCVKCGITPLDFFRTALQSQKAEILKRLPKEKIASDFIRQVMIMELGIERAIGFNQALAETKEIIKNV